MKKGFLVLLSAAAGCLLLGGVLYTTASAMGAKGSTVHLGAIKMIANLNGFHITGNDSDWDEKLEDQLESWIDYDESYSLSSLSSSDTDADHTGFTSLEGKNGSIRIDAESITKIKTDLKTTNLKILAHDTASIQWEDLSQNTKLSYQIQDGVLTIREEENNKNSISFGHSDGEIYIALPKNETLEVSAASGTGDIELQSIDANSIQLANGTGDIDLENVSADSLMLALGVGDIEIESCTLGTVEAVTGTGDIDINAILSGDLTAKTGMGDIEIALPGILQSYSYDCKAGMGNITVNDSVSLGSYSQNNSNTPMIQAETGMGEIKITTQNK